MIAANGTGVNEQNNTGTVNVNSTTITGGTTGVAVNSSTGNEKLSTAGAGGGAIRSNLETMQDYLEGTGLSDGSAVWEVSELDWSAEHPANARFLEANVPWIAGSLVVACLVGETS